jgi:outer membrane protein TolC
LTCTFLILGSPASGDSQEPWRFILPEQRRMEIRDPAQLPRARFADLPQPRTVSSPEADAEREQLSLDQAIRTALETTQVVRILAGVTAVSSGRTIYDAAITNTQIDTARSRFDPQFQLNNNFFRSDSPTGAFVPGDGRPPQIFGVPGHQYNMTMGVTKDTVTGGTGGVSVDANSLRSEGVVASPEPGVPSVVGLNPQGPSSAALSYTQPLLQGAGVAVNVAPIVIARIDTERSFFQLKDSVQDMVRGVVDGYWSLVQARIEAWARRQQVAQGQEAYEFAKASLEVGRGNAAEVAQALASLATFRASLVTAEASVLQREAALRNILGWPPSGQPPIVPVTPMSTERFQPNWEETLRLAEEQRPDLIELKLILEADQQRLRMARNQALPRLDAVALYRWNGLEGKLPDGTFLRANPNDFTEWQLGVNFSVPLGLRKERANVRQQELLIMHDRANLEQGLHAAAHDLARSVRNLAQYYEQYRAFAEAREAAWVNLDRQQADYREGRGTLYLNVLQAITDWGNAVHSEALSLAFYNTELANLERETGTILESHGIRFLEERFCSIGPLGRMFRDRPYPMASPLEPNADRYPASTEPAEKSLKLEEPLLPRRDNGKPVAPMPGQGRVGGASR